MKRYIRTEIQQTFRLSLCILAIPLPIAGFSQNLDSLEQVLKTQKLTDTEKMKVLDDLNWFYNSIDADRSIAFGKQGLALARKTGDEKMVATFLKNIGIAYYMDGINDTALIYLEEAKPLVEQLDNYRMQTSVYNAYGNIYRVQSFTTMQLKITSTPQKFSKRKMISTDLP